MAGPPLIPVIVTVVYPKTGGREDRFDVCLGFVYSTRVNTLRKLVTDGATFEEKRSPGRHWVETVEYMPESDAAEAAE